MSLLNLFSFTQSFKFDFTKGILYVQKKPITFRATTKNICFEYIKLFYFNKTSGLPDPLFRIRPEPDSDFFKNQYPAGTGTGSFFFNYDPAGTGSGSFF